MISNTKLHNNNKLKMCLQVKLTGKSSVEFKMFFIDENIDIKNGDSLYSDSNMYTIKKGNEFEYRTYELIIPTNMNKHNFSNVFYYTYLEEINRKYLLRALAKKLLLFINNGTFEPNSNSRIEYKNDFWLFY